MRMGGTCAICGGKIDAVLDQDLLEEEIAENERNHEPEKSYLLNMHESGEKVCQGSGKAPIEVYKV